MLQGPFGSAPLPADVQGLKANAENRDSADEDRRQCMTSRPRERNTRHQRQPEDHASKWSTKPHAANLTQVVVSVVVGFRKRPVGYSRSGVDWSLDVAGVDGPVDRLHLPGAATDLAVAPSSRAQVGSSELTSAASAGATAGVDGGDCLLSNEHRFGSG